MTKYSALSSYPGYRFGSDGSVWSKWKNRWGIGDGWRRMATPKNNKYGRSTCRLRSNDGLFTTRYVHHLVLEAFVGPRPNGCEALHNDGNAWNNTLENLRWGSRDENLADFRRHGRKKGVWHHRAKLTDGIVTIIRERARHGETQQAIADSVGVNREAIGKKDKRER